MSFYISASYIAKSLGKSWRSLPLLATLVIIHSFLIGCDCNSNSDAQSDLYFPVQRDPGFIYMQARTEGRLILCEGCLRLKPTFGSSYMIIWPYGYKLRIEDKTIQVLNADGQAVACVGDWIELGGGVSDSIEFIENYIGQPLPPDCTGPYWIAGTIIR